MTPHLVVAASDTLAARFAAWCRALAVSAVAARGRFTLGIPGGSVARAFLPVLAAEALPWERTHVYWCDERCVPPGDPDANAGLLRALWRNTAALTHAHLHPMDGGAADAAAAARRYAAALESSLGAPPRLDLLVLGVGEDGHVGSLFPGRPALAEQARWTVAVTDAPKPPPRRLTITMPVIAAASVLCVAAFGQAKAAPLRAALTEPASDLPVARALRAATEAWVYLDPPAAAGVPPERMPPETSLA